MGLFSLPSHTRAREVPVAEARSTADDAETGGGHGKGSSSAPENTYPTATASDSDAVSVDAQAGVQQAEATAKVWTVKHIVLAYFLIWAIYFVDATQQGVSSGMLPYVTSAFRQHSLTAATGIMAHLLGGLLKLPLAKILDIWGRPQGFVFTTFILTVGLVMMAACQNVQTFAAAQVFYWVGYNGMTYTLHIFIADTSALKNRALMFAFSSSPYIITTWIAGPLAARFLAGPGWRWAFGAFAIITPIVSLPLVALFTHNFRKAKAQGLMPDKGNSRTLAESVRYYLIEFDVVGLLLIAVGLALFLLPFSLYTYQPGKWRSPFIICMLVFGVIFIVAFVLYEKFVAPVQFLPYALLADRTIMGAMVLALVLFVAFFIWDIFFSSFLQVVNGLSVTHATYVGKIHVGVTCFWAIIVGVLIRVTGRFKWLALYFGIFIACAGGTIVVCEQMAVMASVSHQHIAVILAIQAMFASVGGAIGSTIAAALWTGIFPRKLAKLLPPESQASLARIYGNLSAQLEYPIGSPTREAISQAYGETQRLMLISAMCVLSLAVVAVAVWRDIRVKDFKQVKGLVV
ncbi:siderophore iron transporter mirB [Ophiocordyceps sinensis CO18]|uniref:Siderophore iron transporter mirB n=1 Tax=Ophiocordyceps sinensis (strain Co18 / CGMCC 3.14243) TaxID=911162 RepID=T5AIS2_OPHSC|nr:siderophore iron transporter mirB [Ophiocordyceps sinensis CO18]